MYIHRALKPGAVLIVLKSGADRAGLMASADQSMAERDRGATNVCFISRRSVGLHIVLH